MILIKAIMEVWRENKVTSKQAKQYYYQVFDESDRIISSFTNTDNCEYELLHFQLKYAWRCDILKVDEIIKNKLLKIKCYDNDNKMHRTFTAIGR